METPASDPLLSHAQLSRRGVITLAGAGVALGALGDDAVAVPADAVPADAAQAAPSSLGASEAAVVPRLLNGARYPIGMWWPPHPFATNDERYAEMAEAGFTFAIGGNYLNDQWITRWALAAAERAGLDFVPVDPDLGTLTHSFDAGVPDDRPFVLSDEEVVEGVRQALGRYPGQAFAGINLYDEPSPPKFATLAKYVAAVQALAPEALPYINLFPSNDIAYVRGFVETVRPPFVSFDRYPLLLGGDDQGWWDNLQIVRTVGLEAGIPYWVFIQSIKYANHRMPTAAELSWQIGIALAYGYKGIQYFTYWTPDPARGEAFEPALITVDGKRTDLWHAAKKINPMLQAAGTRILPLTSHAVSVTGVDAPPAGLPVFEADEWIVDATGAPVVIGAFAAAGDASSRTLIIANYSHAGEARATLTFGQDVTRVEFEESPGQRPPRVVGNPADIRLPAGGFTVVTLTRG
ncbi:hypothetical protein ABN028_17200 [Actinopolymorpha sp. B17G11]|uniref:hypothetical protein n=1 Tax=Actinopolymorpha sp. B17G11 TaxID=3160861 RepID=UPI0032E443BE